MYACGHYCWCIQYLSKCAVLKVVFLLRLLSKCTLYEEGIQLSWHNPYILHHKLSHLLSAIYSHTKNDALSTIFCVKNCHQYLYSRKFLLIGVIIFGQKQESNRCLQDDYKGGSYVEQDIGMTLCINKHGSMEMRIDYQDTPQ